MQKKKILIYSLIIASILSVFLLSKYIGKEPSSLDEVRLKDTVINKNNNLAIMLETEADSGKYEEADSIVFPKSQYKFNAELSGCLDMNGLKIDNVLTYKDGMAYVEVGTSAYCYLYFNLPPKFVNYLLNEKTRPTSLWTSTLDGDGYRFVGGNTNETHCSYNGGKYTEVLTNPDDSCPTVYKYYDETYEEYYYIHNDCNGCTVMNGVKALPNPNNYICFGTTDKDACVANTDLYMYRIIGVFKDSAGNNHLKLIKKEALNATYPWNSAYTTYTNWEGSDLYAGTNGNYFLNNSLYLYMQNADWADMITDWTWGVATFGSWDHTPEEIYYKEMNHANNSITSGGWTTASGKIGLMYASDYLLAFGESLLSISSRNYEFKQGWIHLANNDSDAPDMDEWIITYFDFGSSGYAAFNVTPEGKLSATRVDGDYSVRPVFYLNTDVLYDSGSGSSTDPFIIYTEAEESALPTYTITGSSNNTSAGTVTVDTPTVEHGGTAQWTISVNSGYYYSSNSCGATKSGNTLTLTNVTSDTSCTVYFYKQSTTTYYAVYVTSNDTTYGTVSPTGVSVIAGGSTSITLNPAAGYEYKSNNCGGTVSGNTMTISSVNKNINCTVTFGRPSVTITVSSNNTSYGTVSPGSQTVPQGEAATFTLSPATGYKYSSNTCGGTVSGNTMTVQQVGETTSCTVSFARLTYKVTLTINNRTTGTNETQRTLVQHGGTASFDVTSYVNGMYLMTEPTCGGLMYDGSLSGNTVNISNVTSALSCTMTVIKSI